MARNKYPELTAARILNVSLALFLQKGYDHTSIQDIIDALGDLSKGAIYHHFKSKEAIIDAAMEKMMGEQSRGILEIVRAGKGTGLERLKQLFNLSVCSPNQRQVMEAAPNMMQIPYFFLAQFRSCIQEVAPLYLAPLIRQGLADGSIDTEYPEELAEVMAMLANLWLNPMGDEMTEEQLTRRYGFLRHMLEKLGVPFLDDEMLENILAMNRLVEKARAGEKVNHTASQ